MKTLTFFLIVSVLFQLNGRTVSGQKPEELTRPGSHQLLTSWMDLHLKIIPECKTFNHHTRQLAYTGIAFYESIVAGAPGYQSLAGQLVGFNNKPVPPVNSGFSWLAGANKAIASVLRHFYTEPVNQMRIDSMEQAMKMWIREQGFDDASIAAGADYGNRIAMAIIDWSKSDGADKASDPYTTPAGDGLWQPTPPAFVTPSTPHMGKCRPFVKGSIDNTLPPPPVRFSKDPDSEFYKMVEEVYRVSLEKNDKNKNLALYWDDFPNGKTLTAGGHWESILKTVIKQLDLSLMEGSRVFAGLYITMQDAAVGCFKAKYTYNLMRPVTYVQNIMNHKDWLPLITTPPHPEYPAAHATVSMAAATILTHLLGDNIAFTDNTYAYRNYPKREYANFKAAGTDAGMSRFYGGIHYKPSIQAGFEQGTKIADHIAGALEFRSKREMSEK